MTLVWVARVGQENARWLTGPDSPLAGTGTQAHAHEHGDAVWLDERAYYQLCALPDTHDGHTERTGPLEARMWIEGDPYPVERREV